MKNGGAIILASQPFRPPDNGHQLELLSPAYILESALKPFLETPLEQIVLVLGHDYHHLLNGIKALPDHASVVIHRKPERGPGSALAVGLQALHSELKSVIIARGDQTVEARTLEILLRAFEKEAAKLQGTKKIVVPIYHGKRGLPWVVSCELRKSMLKLEGDLALSTFLKNHRKDVLAVQVDARESEKETM